MGVLELSSSASSLFFLDGSVRDGDLWGNESIRGASRLDVGRYQPTGLLVYTLHRMADEIPSASIVR